MAKFVALVVGSVFGGLARYYLAGAVYRVLGASFPYGTLVVNLAGCFLIGFLSAVSEEKFALGSTARLLLMVGFCGAFTTFSTYILETGNLVKDGEIARAFLNILVSTAAGFIVYWLGVVVGDLI